MNNKIALVTGASSGIGEALCRELVTDGWYVIGIARSKDLLEDLQKELSENNFLFYPCDVAKAKEIEAVSSQLKQRKTTPQLFFLNAGISGKAALEPTDYFDVSHHKKIFDVNYFGVLHWLKEWEISCQQAGGATFMVTSSVLAFFAPPKGSAYSASKAAIAKAFEGLKLQYANTNLNLSVVYPGPVNTKGFTGHAPFTWSPEKMARYMIRKALLKKAHCEPSFLYSFLCKMIRWMPDRLISKMTGT